MSIAKKKAKLVIELVRRGFNCNMSNNKSHVNKQPNTETKRKPSKRERRMKVVIYIMVIAMALSTFTAAAALF